MFPDIGKKRFNSIYSAIYSASLCVAMLLKDLQDSLQHEVNENA